MIWIVICLALCFTFIISATGMTPGGFEPVAAAVMAPVMAFAYFGARPEVAVACVAACAVTLTARTVAQNALESNGKKR